MRGVNAAATLQSLLLVGYRSDQNMSITHLARTLQGPMSVLELSSLRDGEPPISPPPVSSRQFFFPRYTSSLYVII